MAVSLPVQSAICMVHKLFRVGVQVSCVHSLDRFFGRPYRLYQDRLFTNSPSDSWSRLSTHSRYLTTAAAAPSKTSVSSVPSNDPQLHKIVDEISNLTLLQAADLVTLLKVSSAISRVIFQTCLLYFQSRLNIQEIALPAAPTSPAGSASTAPEETAAVRL